MKERILKARSFKEVANIFGYSYYNGTIKKDIVQKCKNLYNLDIESIVNENKKPEKKYCLYCGEEIKGENKKFCNSSCAASYNNKNRKVSEEQKRKTSESLKEHFKQHGYPKHNNIPRITNKNGKTFATFLCVCKECGKEFYSRVRTRKYCSRSCSSKSEEVKNKIREKCKERINNGTFVGWKSRNITSYAEKFWINVLDNNGIKYTREFYENGYFLDFYIDFKGYKIDLEIDGKQHKYENRKQHDLERDRYLTELGFIIYRID